MSFGKNGDTTRLRFAVVNDQGALVTGLLDGAFTKTLRKDTASSAVTVTVTELGSTGVYEATAACDANGEWSLLLEHSVYGKWFGQWSVHTRDSDDLAYPATSGRSLAVSAAGAVDANLAAGAITTASFAAGAIDAAAIGTGAIDADALATDAVTEIQTAVAAGSVASVAGSVGSVTAGVTLADGAITSAKFAAGAIDATAIAADAIGSSELAASAVSEIAAAVSVPSAATIAAAVADEALSGHTTAGSLGEALLRLRSTILHSGTLQSASELAASASSDDQAYRGALLIPTGGTGAGQRGGLIATYNGTTKAFTTYQSFGTALDNTTAYVILAVSDYSRYVGDLLGSVASLGAGAITSSSISGGAITAAKIATDAIGAAQLAADAVAEIQSGLAVPGDAMTLEDGAISPGKIVDSTLGAAKFADDAITASKIAANAIGSSQLAASAVAEIQSGLATDASITSIAATLATISAYVDELESRLTSGRAANLDNLDVAVSTRLAAAGYTAPPTAAANALELLDTQTVKSLTLRDTLARIAASSHGKVSGMASGTPIFRHQDDSGDAISATVDVDGNRTAVTLP